MYESQPKKRRSIINFFIKPKLQIKFTLLFVIVAFSASFVSLFIIFILKSIDLDGLEGLRTAWYYLKVTFPGFWVASVVSLMAGVFVGTSASRKVALPIFKVEQWAKELKSRRLTERLGMRDSDYWGDMSELCNDFLKVFQEDISSLKESLSGDDKSLRSNVEQITSKYTL